MPETGADGKTRSRRRQALAVIAVVLVVGIKLAPQLRRLVARHDARPSVAAPDHRLSQDLSRVRGMKLERSRSEASRAHGLRVVELDPQSLWFGLGLRRGDLIEMIGTELVASPARLVQALASEEEFYLLIERNGATRVLEVPGAKDR